MFEEWEEVGVVGVDAGLVWIGDPCYILHPENPPEEIGKTWIDFCDKLDWEETTHQFRYDNGGEGLGVVVSSGYGDGTYPVFVRRTRDGRVAEVRVVFISREDE
jgi:hypothetical protein